MRVRKTQIQRAADKLLTSCKVKTAPVPLKELAVHLGIKVIYHKPVSEEARRTSGFIMRRGDETLIGVNNEQEETRQRWTLAHELGHYCLHDRDRHYSDSEVFRRNRDDDQSFDVEEIEANRFAIALLMPAWLMSEDVPQGPLSERQIVKLADKYEVGQPAMAIRLTQLGYSTPYS